MAASGVRVFEEYESNVRSYSRVFPTVFARARNATIWDEAGKAYTDFFSGAGTLNYGHNPPEIRAQLVAYLESEGIIHALDAYTVEKRRFLDTFVEGVLRPRKLDFKVQFCGPTGANGVEAALKLARRVTGRTGVIAFGGSYHGMSMGSGSVTGSTSVRRNLGVPTVGVSFVPYESGPQGPFDSVGYLERVLADSSSGVDAPAAIIVEPVQLDGGIYVGSPAFMQGLRAVCDRYGALLICDEIQAGVGRAGHFFSFEASGVVPDLVTVSKSIGGYGLPMSLVLMRREHDHWKPGEHTGTFRGNQLAFVAATAALEYWTRPAFTGGLADGTRYLRDVFAPAARALHPDIEVRGVGMVAGVDLTRVGGNEAARRAASRCFEKGLIIECCGRDDSVMKVMPPLTTPPEQLAEGCRILLDAIRAGLPGQG
ncbi:diaminobutyrate--2-oxoglutarate transaminase [Pyxidicoccus caerfyrddinensis]|jgi:diaminobutyrate-2-oxoglutarate transaminase|uniref:diaminobutyrate--2-oxoglutarate transaminase n=1 Tax=Pyxidicoccus caerfyrddinensis TaxID=2709663 RepID=UPI0013DBCE2B|nr:diaminobutyrate--2-oxoglutarate transaminase [Pyxidicoccus caerfyrddinensis]